jgi:hypothetical protein
MEPAALLACLNPPLLPLLDADVCLRVCPHASALFLHPGLEQIFALTIILGQGGLSLILLTSLSSFYLQSSELISICKSCVIMYSLLTFWLHNLWHLQSKIAKIFVICSKCILIYVGSRLTTHTSELTQPSSPAVKT